MLIQLRVRDDYDWSPTRCSLRPATIAQEPGVHSCSRDHLGAWHWRKHRNFHFGKRCAAQIAAGAKSGATLSSLTKAILSRTIHGSHIRCFKMHVQPCPEVPS